jgi:hypothetical protein
VQVRDVHQRRGLARHGFGDRRVRVAEVGAEDARELI